MKPLDRPKLTLIQTDPVVLDRFKTEVLTRTRQIILTEMDNSASSIEQFLETDQPDPKQRATANLLREMIADWSTMWGIDLREIGINQ